MILIFHHIIWCPYCKFWSLNWTECSIHYFYFQSVSSITFLLSFLHTNLSQLSQIWYPVLFSVWWNEYLWQQFFRRVSMTAFLRLLGSKDFHLSSIILESNGITMYLWTCLPHSAGKTPCMTMLWFSLLLTKYCEKNIEKSNEKNIVRKILSCILQLRKILPGKTGKLYWEEEQKFDLPTEQIENSYFLCKAKNKKSL